MKKLSGARTRFLLWIAAVIALSLLPLDLKYELGTKGALHDGGHVVAFAVTAWLYLDWRRPCSSRVWRVWPVALLAIAMEAAQAGFYENDFEWRDIATDALGIGLAAAIYIIRRRNE